MARVLSIIASPRGKDSFSGKVADAFLRAYAATHEQDEIDTLNLWSEPLPDFDDLAANGKYKILRGKPHSAREAQAWRAVEAVIDRFRTADRFVVSAPMWNFSIPYRLKQFLDIVVQPGLTFSHDPTTGYTGLVTGKPVQLILARGDSYDTPEGAAMDFQRPYLEFIFGFIGCREIHTLTVEPTLGPPEVFQAGLERALAAAHDAGHAFAGVC